MSSVGMGIGDGMLCGQYVNECFFSPNLLASSLDSSSSVPKGSVTHTFVQEGLGRFREILSRGRERARVIRGVWRIICVPG